MDKIITLTPRLSEKSYGLSQTQRTYVFSVPGSANRHSVARAVAGQYEVTVTSVNIANVKGKAKRTVYKRGRSQAGQQANLKKAYVTLKDGDSLPIFDAIQAEEAKQQKTQEKMTEAIEKKTAKDAKPARGILHRAKKEEA